MNIKSVHKLRSGYCFNPHFWFTTCTVWMSATCCGGYVLKSLFVQIVYFITSSSHQRSSTNTNVRIKSNKKECSTFNFTCDDLLMDKNAFLPCDFFSHCHLNRWQMCHFARWPTDHFSFPLPLYVIMKGFYFLIKCQKRFWNAETEKWNWFNSFLVWNCHSIDTINSRLFFIHVFFFVFTMRPRSKQENPQDWHGQMGIYVWARTKHDNNINKLKYVLSL